MARVEFEDMPWHDWPNDLQALRQAAVEACDTYGELDYTLSLVETSERGELYILAADAYRLLERIRVLGLAWEARAHV